MMLRTRQFHRLTMPLAYSFSTGTLLQTNKVTSKLDPQLDDCVCCISLVFVQFSGKHLFEKSGAKMMYIMSRKRGCVYQSSAGQLLVVPSCPVSRTFLSRPVLSRYILLSRVPSCPVPRAVLSRPVSPVPPHLILSRRRNSSL